MKLAGTITAAFGRHYEITLGDGRIVKGIPRGKKSPFACGDRVELGPLHDQEAQILGHLERTSLLYRSDQWKEKLIAANTTIAATNHEYRSRNQTIIEQRFMPSKGGVVIEEDCWIGANCVLLDGTVLHRGCVVGAGTVLKGEWPEYSVVAGSPAKIVRSRVCA